MLVVPNRRSHTEPNRGRPAGRVFLAQAYRAKQCLEVDALELRPAVDDYCLWQPLVAAHTLTQRQHAGPVTGWVEGQAYGQQPAREGIAQERCPRPSQVSPGAGADQLHVQLCVVEMSELERAVPVSRGRQAEFPAEGRSLHSCS